jgi:hypothetical protein
MNSLFNSVASAVASNMVRKASLTSTLKESESSDREFVIGNAKQTFSGTTVAVIGTGFQIGAPVKESMKSAPLAEWIIEWTFPRLTADQAAALSAELAIRHSRAVESEAAGVPVIAGGAEHIRKMWEKRFGAGSVLEPIGSTPKSPNSSIMGEVATVFVADGSAEITGEMNDDQFAALEAAYNAALQSRGCKPVKAAKPRKPKVKSSVTVVKNIVPASK